MMLRRDVLAGLALSGLAGPAFARQGRVIEAPIRLANGRVLVQVGLNGRGPYDFVIDTGAEISGLQQSLADELGLRVRRRVRLNAGMFPLYELDEIVYGGVIRQPNAALFGLEGARLGGHGLLAAGVVTAFDSELEFERGVWRVHPDGAQDLSGYTAIPSQLKTATPGASLRPFGEIDLDGVRMQALWDTGAPRALTVDYDTGRRLGLTAPDRPYAPVFMSSIRGANPRPGHLVRCGRLTIGGATYDNPLVLVRMEQNGMQQWGGLLGLPVIQTLDMAFDRRRKSIAVRRNGLEVGLTPYGLSGLWLDEDGGRVVVSEVGVGSPAAAAGVQAGDVVDGVANLRAALDRLAGEPGAPVELSLVRDGAAVDARFELRAYL